MVLSSVAQRADRAPKRRQSDFLDASGSGGVAVRAPGNYRASPTAGKTGFGPRKHATFGQKSERCSIVPYSPRARRLRAACRHKNACMVALAADVRAVVCSTRISTALELTRCRVGSLRGLKRGNHASQRTGLLAQTRGSCRRLLDKCSILLCSPV